MGVLDPCSEQKVLDVAATHMPSKGLHPCWQPHMVTQEAKRRKGLCNARESLYRWCSFYSELPCQVARGGTEGRGAAAGAGKGGPAPAEKPIGGEGKVGEVGVVGDIVADFAFFSFTAGGTFS